MAHQHSVYDTDPHFKIDSFSRAITDLSEKQIKLMQGDHNSERFTFEIDRRVDGHDMTQCDRVEVHYLNVDGSTKESFGDVYEVDDMSTSPVSDNVVIFSWLVSKNATGFAGTLNFRIRFVCTDETGNVVYAWHTDIFKGITVSSGISNTAAAVEEYSDVLAKWQRDLFEQGSTSVANVNVAREAAISAVQDEGAAQIAAVEAKGAATLESIPDDFSAVAAEAEANTAAIIEVDEHRAALESRTTRQTKLIKNLSQAIQNANDGITPEPYDSAPAFKWSVPENALPFAKIREIGGATYKEGDVLRSAPVSEVVSVGANIWDEVWFNASLNENTGVFTEASSADVSSKNHIPVLPNTQYYISVSCWVAFYDINKAFVSAISPSGGVFNTPSNCYFIKFQTLLGMYGAVYKNDIIISKSTTALPYKPYIKRTLQIPEAVRPAHGIPGTDIYDRIRWRYDEASDKWVRESDKRLGAVDMGTLTWKASSGTPNGFYTENILNVVPYRYSSTTKMICDKYEFAGTRQQESFFGSNKQLTCWATVSGSGGEIRELYVLDTDYVDVTSFKSALSGVMLYYELATPEITDISDILPEDNLLGVEAYGDITAVNEFGYAVPMIIK